MTQQKFTLKSMVNFGQLVAFAFAVLIALTGFGAWQGATNEKVQTVQIEQKKIKKIIETQTAILERQQAQNEYIIMSIKRHEDKFNTYDKDIKEFYKSYKLSLK